MAVHRVVTTKRIDETPISLYQVVHEAGDFPRDWVVISLAPETVTLASLDFDEQVTVDIDEISHGPFTPVTAGGLPVWGY